MSTVRQLSAVLTLGFLLVATIPPSGAAPPPESPVTRRDPDGGTTISLLLEDGFGGTYEKTSVETARLERQIEFILGDDVDMGDVKEAGYFRHEWTHAGAPMVTVGVFVDTREAGLLRLPLVIFENQDAPEPLLLLLLQLVQGDVLPFARNELPFLLNWAFPEIVDVVDGPTTTWGDYEEYPFELDDAVTYPTVYAWIARREAGGASVWAGLYVLRTGSSSGSSAASESEKRVEVGVATRVNGVETRAAGVQVTQEAWHTLSPGQFAAGADTDHGLVLAGLDVVALRLRQTDEREGPDFRSDVRSRGDMQVGVVGPDGTYVPLAQSRTDDERRPGPDGTGSQTRTTTVGPVAPGLGYVPVAGARYVADNRSLLLFPQHFYFGGLVGGERSGDAELAVGVVAGDAFVPLLAVQYRDDVPGATRKHQALVTVGTYVAGRAQPLLGFAYEGDRLPQDFAQGLAGGGTLGSRLTGNATFTVATFVDGAYTPLLGVEWLDHVTGRAGRYEYQGMLRVGPYVAGAFTPVLGLAYDGEQPFSVFASEFALGGTFGSPTTRANRWELAFGPIVADRFLPAVGVQHQPSVPGGARAYQTLVSVGTYLDDAYQPVLGVGYDGGMPLSFWSATFLATGAFGSRAAPDWTLAVGTFLPGSGVAGWSPLALVHYHDDVPAAAHAKQSRVTMEVSTPVAGPFLLFEATWDGERTFGEWLAATAGQDAAQQGPWTAGAGTAAPHHPLVGARYVPDHGGSRAYAECYEAGVFGDIYPSFTPLAYLCIAGDASPFDWAGSFVTGGTLGSRAGGLDVATHGATVRHASFASGHDAVVVETLAGPGVAVAYRDGSPGGLVQAVRDGQAFHLSVGRTANGFYAPLVEQRVPGHREVLP